MAGGTRRRGEGEGRVVYRRRVGGDVRYGGKKERKEYKRREDRKDIQAEVKIVQRSWREWKIGR